MRFKAHVMKLRPEERPKIITRKPINSLYIMSFKNDGNVLHDCTFVKFSTVICIEGFVRRAPLWLNLLWTGSLLTESGLYFHHCCILL